MESNGILLLTKYVPKKSNITKYYFELSLNIKEAFIIFLKNMLGSIANLDGQNPCTLKHMVIWVLI